MKKHIALLILMTMYFFPLSSFADYDDVVGRPPDAFRTLSFTSSSSTPSPTPSPTPSTITSCSAAVGEATCSVTCVAPLIADCKGTRNCGWFSICPVCLCK